MKKLIKIVLWIAGAIAFLLIVAALAFYLNFRRATKAMTPAATGAINDSVWVIKDNFVNAFLFKGRNGYLMVDAGINAKNFKKEMDLIGINPDQISALFLTHTDGDHIGAISLLKKVRIYMHRDEEQMINGITGKTKFFKPKWKFGPYILLEDKDSLIIDGLKIKILHTPGHTPGSSCFIIGNDYFLTGDNLCVSGDSYVHFIDRFNMNTLQQIESIKHLPSPRSFKYILTGHNGVVKVR
jgi:glyoxylase-like metal-dependent hydrolase (beta-lactamase superfamily II)